MGPVGVAVHGAHGGEGGGHGEGVGGHGPRGDGGHGAAHGAREHGGVVKGGVRRVAVNGDALSLDRLPLPCLDVVLLQMDWPVHPMDLVVEAARIADNSAALLDSPPERGCPCAAVGACCVAPLLQAAALLLALLDQGPVAAVHLVVEAASVAEVITSGVPPPERSLAHPAVDTLSRGRCVGLR